MSTSTKIEWTEATWNPVTGCTKISEGSEGGGGLMTCTVTDGILYPCTGLGRSVEERGRGIIHQVVTDFSVDRWKVVKSFAMLNSGDFKKNGIVLNFCPFCGKDIGSHMRAKAKEATA